MRKGVCVGVHRHGSDTLRRGAKGPTELGEGVKILVMAARTAVSEFNDRAGFTIHVIDRRFRSRGFALSVSTFKYPESAAFT